MINIEMIKLVNLESEFNEAKELFTDLDLNNVFISTDKRTNFNKEIPVANPIKHDAFEFLFIKSNDLLEQEAKEQNKEIIVFSNSDSFYNLVVFSDKQGIDPQEQNLKVLVDVIKYEEIKLNNPVTDELEPLEVEEVI